jgi:hypothetical protein
MTDSDLVEIEALKHLKARYFRYLDTKDWVRWRALFSDSCTFPGQPGQSVDALLARLKVERQDAKTVHQGHSPEIRLLEPGRARAIWALHDFVEYPGIAESGRARGYRGFEGFGHYEEEYRKEGGEWKISSFRLTRLRVDALVGDPAPTIGGYPPSVPTDWLDGAEPR